MRSPSRSLTALACSVSAAVFLLAPVEAQRRPGAPLGGSPNICTVAGPDRVCGAEGGISYTTNMRSPPGATFSWSLHTTTTDGCPGTGTATPSFCGPTNLSTVCVVPGVNAGRFVLKVVVTTGTSTSSCCLSINVTATTSTTAPVSFSTCEGRTHLFCTTSSGTGPFTYTWTKNGVLIPGATDSCYNASSGPAGVIDNYCVTATGSGGCGTSFTACGLLTSLANTTVGVLPTPRRCEGVPFQFCATAGGEGPFTYSWAMNGAAIPGATDSCYTATAGTPGTIDSYCVTVNGACGPPITRCGTLTSGINTVTTSLTPASVCEGSTHTFCTNTTGQGVLVYSWTKNGATIPGATGTCYTATAGPSGTIDDYCVSVTGTCGTAQSCATLTSTANTSASTFDAASVCESASQSFCVTAGGTGPFTFSWTKNGTSIPGATSSCYTATAAAAGTVDTYCASVQGPCGPPSSSCFELTATASTQLVSLQPASGCPGSAQNLCVTVSGTGPFAFAWSKNTVAIPGATASCYTATVGGAGSVDTYCVSVTGPCGSVAPCTTVTAIPGTTATELGSATACEGLTQPFCTTAGGTGPFTYSWTKNAVAIPGATGSCYTATAGAGGVIDTYCVTVTGACGAPVQRCATLTSNSNVTATTISNATKCEGLTHQFCTTAGGTGPFTYSWTKNAAAIPGATGSCYTATAGAGGAVDTYCVTVSGACGTPVQRCATLTSNSNVSATTISNVNKCAGATHQFCTTAGGTGPFTYSWTKNGTTISGATSNCYTATAGASGTVDTYCVTVTGACGSPVQRCASLSANAAAGATNLPGTSGCVGEPVSVCTTASGTGPFTYQWTRNGAAVPGQTASCYAFDLAPGDTQVCVTVTGACGSVVRCASLRPQACGGSHCTLTQGAYGNSGGQFNGMARLALITDLLQGDMTVGVLGTRSLTFQDGVQDAQCIIDRLPTGGSADTLPNFGDEVLEADCQTSPTPILLSSGRFQNILLGQVITLSLNVRLASGVSSPNGCTTNSTGLSAQTICETMVSQCLLAGPDGCRGTSDDVPAGANETITIGDSVMDSLAALFLPQTVGGVLQLGNRALAGLSTGTASLSEVSAAVDSINILFDECRELVDCQDQ